jgi:hypothetical protein
MRPKRPITAFPSMTFAHQKRLISVAKVGYILPAGGKNGRSCLPAEPSFILPQRLQAQDDTVVIPTGVFGDSRRRIVIVCGALRAPQE